jgi:hypothetical protein
MAANTYLEVTDVDFEDIRSNLKTYLGSQTQFQDYDFEGSNMAVLLDILAYNTHYNAFYTNMIANEMFLDTAQQRDSVVSRSKELGYVTRSARGATANVTLTFTGISNTVSSFTLPKNSKFTTTIDDIAYTFVTPTDHVIENNANTFSKAISIKEGEPLTHRFTVNTSNPVRYVLPNQNVDTSSITVRVQESASNLANTAFTEATNIRGVTSESAVYYLQECADQQYEIYFSTGALGKPLKNNNVIIVDYLVCNGPETNGANTFTIDTINITPSYTSASLTVNSVARGGVNIESVDSIKFNAPRNYEIQNRAVIKNDYDRIILNENTDLQSVTAFGGELADPPVYGKVYIAIKPTGEQFATAVRKSEIRETILDRTPLGIDPVMIDPDYIYIIPTITTFYDSLKTTLTAQATIQACRDAVDAFDAANLERFGNKLRYSRFVRALDNTNESILNNNVSIKIQKRFVPNTQQAQKVTLRFSNAIRPNSLLSTKFTYNNFDAFLDDDGNGNVNIFRYNAAKQKVNIVTAAGTVNYTTGLVEVERFNPSAYDGIEMKVTVEPVSVDVTPVREQILIMNGSDATITAVGETN